MYCATIQVFGDDLKFRELTDEEHRELPAEILKEREDTVRYNKEMEEWRADPEAAERRAEHQHDEAMKEQRLKLDRRDELIKQLQNGLLDSEAIADITEALEELKADYRVRIDIDEWERGVFEPHEPPAHRLDELIKQERSRLDRLDELTSSSIP